MVYCDSVSWQNTISNGLIGKIRFDENGDMVGTIEAYQYQSLIVNGKKSYVPVKIGNYTNDEYGMLSVDIDKIIWDYSSKNTNGTGKPESTCSRPCHEGEYAVQLTAVCCWQCLKCPEDGNVSLCLLSHSLNHHTYHT